MKCAVTGAGGFVGSHLVRQLRALKNEVISIGTHVSEAHHSFEMDLSEEAAVHACLAKVKPDQIYHLAGSARVSGVSDFDPFYRMNFLTTRVICDGAMKMKHPTHLLLASSIHVYGQAEGSVDERFEIRPESDYGFTKYLAEQYVRKATTESEGRVKALIARFGNAVGPDQAPGFVVADFCVKIAEVALGKRDSIRVGTLKAQRQFLDVRDLVVLLPKILESSRGQAFTIFNVASPELVSIGDVLEILIQVSKTAPKIEEDPNFAVNQMKVLKVDTAKLEKVFASRYFRPLKQTLQDTYEATYQRLSKQ